MHVDIAIQETLAINSIWELGHSKMEFSSYEYLVKALSKIAQSLNLS